jgi:quercetin dioxygenase-like cupin family protein
MAGMIRKNLDEPEETRPFQDGKGKLDLVDIENGGVGRGVYEPGWQWSKHVKPLVNTDSCQAGHTGYVISGRLKVTMNDGEEMEFGPGDYIVVQPGHDAVVVGDEACVMLDWQGHVDYAKQRST